MKVHNLTIESGQRDASVHANPNDYVVSLETPIYDVSQIKLVSARIPTPQLLICGTNQAFDFDVIFQSLPTQTFGITYSQGNYDGVSLAAGFASVGKINFNMGYDASKNRFTMGVPTHADGHAISQIKFKFKTGPRGFDDTSAATQTTMHQILGLPALDVSMPGSDFGAANFDGPNALVLRLSSGSEQLSQTLPTSGQTPYYTGHILLPGGSDFVNVNGADDKLTHNFHSGPLKTISDLRVEFFYMSHGRLIPYDFRNQDHVLKFEITCSTDKLENLTPLPPPDEEKDEPLPVVSIPEEKGNLYKVEYIYIGLIIFTGILLILSMGKRQAA